MSGRVGESQSWKPEEYGANARFVADYGVDLIDDLNPLPGQRIVDIGCGDGYLSARIKARGCDVWGLDPSREMLAAAQAQGIHVIHADIADFTTDLRFNGAFSNAALHWVKDQQAALRNIRAMLEPGAHFAGELGGHGNVAAIAVAANAVLGEFGIDGAALMPWRFPTVRAFAAMLQTAGFAVEAIKLTPRPTILPADMKAWLKTFCDWALAALPEERRDDYLDRVEALLRPALCDDAGVWTADYVRLRFLAAAV